MTFRFISLSPTLKASFARRGERERERERGREREKSFCMFFPITSRSALQHREKKKYCMRKKNFLNFIVCVFVCVCVCVYVCVCVCVCVCLCVFVTCFNRFEGGVGEEMTRGCVLTFLWGRLHREKKD